MDESFSEYVGNLHIHSLYSDGGGAVPEIAEAARKVGLNFILLNDHDHMTDGLHLDEEGFYGETLVLMGLEIGGRHHHYLVYGLNEMVTSGSLGPQEVIDLVNRQGGFGFMAHPFEKGMPFSEKSRSYTWNDLSVRDYTGICIWNFSSRWKERVKTPFHGLFFLLFKYQMLKGPSEKTLLFWDGACLKRRVVAIGGSDAHATVFRWGPLSFLPLSYELLLNSINVHVLLREELSRDLARAKEAIYDALREGRVFIAHERLAPARGFRFHYIPKDGTPLLMGEEMGFRPGTLYIESPERGEIRLYRNGTLEKSWRGQRAAYDVVKWGVYRVEVHLHLFLSGWRPWIFSNPVYLR